MQRFTLAIGVIGAALMLQGCNKSTAGIEKTAYDAYNTDCLPTITAACDAVVGEASAPEVKKLADDGKKVCDGFGTGTIMANPTKYSACEAKLAHYQEAIGGHSYMTDANGITTASLVGKWERACNSRVMDNIAKYVTDAEVTKKVPCPMGANATTIGAAVDYYLTSSRGKLQHEIMKQRVIDNLAELETYTLLYTAAARLYDATGSTPADTSAPFVMISFGAATVMVVGSAALGLKQFLRNRQTSYSSSAMQDDEDEEEAAEKPLAVSDRLA